MIALFYMVCASWTGLFSHICYACQMTRTTSINDNLINKRGTFDDSQVSTTEDDIIFGQKSGSALAGLEVGGREGKACMHITHLKHS